MRWQVLISDAAQKSARKLPSAHRDTLLSFVNAVEAEGPSPAGWDVKRLAGRHREYRLRLGRWRVIYRKDRNELIVTLIRVVPRGDAY